MGKNIDDLSINILRMLSLDIVEKAKSGHPGLPLGGAAVSAKTGTEILTKHDLGATATKLQANDWLEYFDGTDGDMIGKESRKFQVWTIAGFIAAHTILENPEKVSLLSFDSEPAAAGCPLKV